MAARGHAHAHSHAHWHTHAHTHHIHTSRQTYSYTHTHIQHIDSHTHTRKYTLSLTHTFVTIQNEEKSTCQKLSCKFKGLRNGIWVLTNCCDSRDSIVITIPFPESDSSLGMELEWELVQKVTDALAIERQREGARYRSTLRICVAAHSHLCSRLGVFSLCSWFRSCFFFNASYEHFVSNH